MDFNAKFLFCLILFESLKVVLIKMVATLMMPAKFATLALLKIKVIWNGGYDVINRFHDVANKVLSRHSKYIVDVAIGPKFSGSSIFMTEANISSIL